MDSLIIEESLLRLLSLIADKFQTMRFPSVILLGIVRWWRLIQIFLTLETFSGRDMEHLSLLRYELCLYHPMRK